VETELVIVEIIGAPSVHAELVEAFLVFSAVSQWRESLSTRNKENDTMRILPRSQLLIFLLVAFSAASAQLSFGQEWEKILTAGKKEGKIAMIGPVGADRRDVLVEPFQKK